MRTFRPTRLIAIFTITCALLLGGCGGADDGAQPAGPQASALPTPPAAVDLVALQDQELTARGCAFVEDLSSIVDGVGSIAAKCDGVPGRAAEIFVAPEITPETPSCTAETTTEDDRSWYCSGSTSKVRITGSGATEDDARERYRAAVDLAAAGATADADPAATAHDGATGECPLGAGDVADAVGVEIPKVPGEPTKTALCTFGDYDEQGAPNQAKPAVTIRPVEKSLDEMRRLIERVPDADPVDRPEWGDGAFFVIREVQEPRLYPEGTPFVELYTPAGYLLAFVPPGNKSPEAVAESFGDALR